MGSNRGDAWYETLLDGWGGREGRVLRVGVGVEESLDQLELHIEGMSRGKGARIRVQAVGYDR